MDFRISRPPLLSASTSAVSLLLLGLLVAAARVPVARADVCAGTTCHTDYDGFEDALKHTNATEPSSFEGFEGFKKKGKGHENGDWVWTVKTLDFHIPDSDQYTVAQAYDLHVPLGFELAGPGLSRNMCAALLPTRNVDQVDLDADSDKADGKCGDAYGDDERRQMASQAQRAVGHLNIPCSASGWPPNAAVIFAPNSSDKADRKSPFATRYLLTSENHTADNTKLYKDAVSRMQPIFMMSYPAEWNDSMTHDDPDLFKSQVVCVYGTDPSGSQIVAPLVKPAVMTLWVLIILPVAFNLFG